MTEKEGRWWRAEIYTILLSAGSWLVLASFEAKPIPWGQIIGVAFIATAISYSWVYR